MRVLDHAYAFVFFASALTGSIALGVDLGRNEPVGAHHFQEAGKKTLPLRFDDFGDPLPPGAVARIGTTRLRHGESIASLAISRDGTVLASGGHDRDSSARVWETKTGKQMLAVDNQGGFVALSPDGQTLVISGKDLLLGTDSVLRFWDVKSGKETRQLNVQGSAEKPVQGILAIAFSPKGDMLAVETWFQLPGDLAPRIITVRLLSIATGKFIGDLSAAENVDSTSPAFAFSPDGRTLAVIGGKHPRLVHLWETATGKLRAKLGKYYGQTCVFGPDSKTLAVGAVDAIHLIDLQTQKEIRALTGFVSKYGSGPGPLAFSPDGKLLTGGVGYYDDTIRVWDTTNGQIIRQIRKVLAPEGPLTFTPDGKLLISANGSAIRQWDVATGQEAIFADVPGPKVWSVSFSPDGKTLAAACLGLRIYETATRKEIQRHEEEWVRALTFSSDGKHLATGGLKLAWWEVNSGKKVRTFEGHKLALTSVALSLDGQTLISGSYDGSMRLWEIATGKEVERIETADSSQRGAPRLPPVNAVAVVAKTKYVAYHAGGAVLLWNIETKKAVENFAAYHWSDTSMPMAVSPDGRWVACEGKANTWDTVLLYELGSGKPARKLGQRENSGVPHWGLSFAFSPDSKILASASADKSVRLWDVASGKELHRFLGHIDRVAFVTFAPDGKTLASASWDGTVLFWDVERFKV